jgi:hypothetical protein
MRSVSREAHSANLPLLEFEDLRAQKIVRTWNTLNRWIDEKGFPPGRMIGRFRKWTAAEVMSWIERQPSTKLEPRGCVASRKNGGDQ